MRSSKERARLHWFGLALCSLVQLSGCAMPADQLALRQRLEAGVQTPEDSVRFRTPREEQERLVASGQDWPQSAVQVPAGANEDQASVALRKAADAGDLAAAKAALLAGAQVNAGDAWGATPMLRAASKGHADMVRALLRAGADPAGRGTGMTPLAKASLGGHTEVVRLLLASGAATETSTETGEAPLMLAVRMNRVATAAVLIDAGASLRVSTREGDSLCMMAISQNFPAMLGLLLQKGVSPHMPDRDGLLPLYWAEYLQREELVGLLLAAGADPQLKRVAVPASGQYTWREF